MQRQEKFEKYLAFGRKILYNGIACRCGGMADASHSKCDGLSVPVQVRPPAPRRSMLYIACSDFFIKVRARSCRCSSFPNRSRFAGLRFGFGCRPGNNGIYTVAMLHLGASAASLAPFFVKSKRMDYRAGKLQRMPFCSYWVHAAALSLELRRIPPFLNHSTLSRLAALARASRTGGTDYFGQILFRSQPHTSQATPSTG